VKAQLAALGVQEHFWGVRIRPGRPTWFGRSNDCLVFGLPGNPVSAIVMHVLLVRGALRRLQGAPAHARRIPALLTVAVPALPERAQAIRVTLEHAPQGGPIHATPTGRQESHISTSMLGAGGLAFVPAGEGSLSAGALVEVELL
jgi:molybdopterin molybdotransferase